MSRANPVFSVIVPTYERARQLTVCLCALACQNYPRDRFEVIVVDDGSPTSAEASVAAFKSKLNVRLLVQPHSGPAAARNYGARQAAGELLAFTDDDCAPSPGWLRSLASHFERNPDCALGGRTINGISDNLYSATTQLIIDYLHSYFNFDPEHARFFSSNNLAMPTKQFHNLGGFDSAWSLAGGEDRELCDRWLHHDQRLIYVPDVVVIHFHSLTCRSFLLQHFNYGRGAFYYHENYATRRRETLKLEKISFYLGAIRYPFFQNRVGKALPLAVLLVGSQAAQAAGFLREMAVSKAVN